MIRRADARLATGVVLMTAMLCVACSPKRFAVNKLGDALANPGTTYAADDDPELIAAAAPFSLKLIESLLESSPKHEGLLLAAASGFTQYSYAFVQQQADFAEDTSLTRATALRLRARKLDLRARDYGLRGLDVRHEGFTTSLRRDPRGTVRPATKRDVPLLYWTAAAWGAAISVSKDVPELVADQPIVEALIDRALELDETFSAGAIHSFLITYEMARQGVAGDPAVRSRQHFDRAVAVSKGQAASPYVSYAEAVSLSQQNRAEFVKMLEQALAIDINAKPEWRLENLVMQERARWLMSKVPDLFLGSVPDQPF
ncbi:MAG TPA: TRAP transporter TatT component family protein [Gemmatimonadaceae bacterium]|nr:TRAP transporter TatT component family protein [Gemmatimonadaceae bacterium]